MVELPLPKVNPHELTIYQINRYNGTWPKGIALVASGRINLEGLVTDEFTLSQTSAALNNTSTNPKALKAIIHPQEL